jgi:hypothetical protein
MLAHAGVHLGAALNMDCGVRPNDALDPDFAENKCVL